MRDAFKSIAGHAVALVDPQCDFHRCVFILAHMRCGSTALSNILCSRPDVSGYGEAHIRYDGRAALGRLVVNQLRRSAWTPRAPHLFDKILHSRHDEAATPDFFAARAIFVARHPGPAIRSIRSLFAKLGRSEYATDAQAARYYLERVGALSRLWDGFAPERRIGFTHSDLMEDPEAALARVSRRLGFSPPLRNQYQSPAASRRGGGGDPTRSGRHTRIEGEPDRLDGAMDGLAIDPALAQDVLDVYARFAEKVARGATLPGP